MSEPNIKAIRIDERLLHGQGRMWISNLGVNLVIVANDEVAKSHIQQKLMQSLLPASIGVRFFSIEKTCQIIFKAAPRQKIFIIVKDPKDALRLAQGGVPMKNLNVGNIHQAENKIRLTNFVHIGEEDFESLKGLRKTYSVNFDTRTTPLGNDVGSDYNLNGYIDEHEKLEG